MMLYTGMPCACRPILERLNLKVTSSMWVGQKTVLPHHKKLSDDDLLNVEGKQLYSNTTVEFTGSLDIFFTTLKDAPSSSSSFIVHTDQLDDKDETDESIR